jgi:hypothetical protein
MAERDVCDPNPELERDHGMRGLVIGRDPALKGCGSFSHEQYGT